MPACMQRNATAIHCWQGKQLAIFIVCLIAHTNLAGISAASQLVFWVMQSTSRDLNGLASRACQFFTRRDTADSRDESSGAGECIREYSAGIHPRIEFSFSAEVLQQD